MAKRGKKKNVKEPTGKSNNAPSPPNPEPNVEGKGLKEIQISFNEREVEQRITAIKAISNAETDNLLSRIRFVRSYFTSEQLQMPVLQFFEENLLNLSLVKNDKYELYEVELNHRDTFNFFDTAVQPATGGFEFSTKSVKASLLKASGLQIPEFALGELSEDQFPGSWNSFQTPGARSNRLSVGTTPKSLRPPKHGELLISIHGSPLGHFKEENLEAIHESDDSAHSNTNE